MFSEKTFLILCSLLSKVALEPQCSPFHYQEQMLEKMIRLEILVQKMKADMDATQQRVTEMTHRLAGDINLLRSELNESKETKGEAVATKVAFHAKDLITYSPSTGETLVFTTVQLNEGLGYDNTTGKFTAPVKGTYFFATHLCAYGGSGKYLQYDFVKNGTSIQKGIFRKDENRSCFTANVLTLLDMSNQLWLKVRSINTKFWSNTDAYWNTLSGVLLH